MQRRSMTRRCRIAGAPSSASGSGTSSRTCGRGWTSGGRTSGFRIASSCSSATSPSGYGRQVARHSRTRSGGRQDHPRRGGRGPPGSCALRNRTLGPATRSLPNWHRRPTTTTCLQQRCCVSARPMQRAYEGGFRSSFSVPSTAHAETGSSYIVVANDTNAERTLDCHNPSWQYEQAYDIRKH